MKKIVINLAVASALLTVGSCTTDFDQDVTQVKVSSGSANFSKYVALGNSLTSGFRDGTLYVDGQNESYPNMIALQMKAAGGGEFTQPLMQDNIGGFADLGMNGKLSLKVVNGTLAPTYETPKTSFDYGTLNGKQFNNMGVPGAKSYHLVYEGYGNIAGLTKKTANPFFVRFASSASTSVLKDAMAQNPTFFSLWIGNNDVLGYATSGGDGSDPITPKATFQAAYTALIKTLTSQGAKGVVANIPSVTDIPYFTTIPYNPVPLDEATAGQLNTHLVNRLKPILTALGEGNRLQTLSVGQNPLLIVDKSLKDLSQTITSILVRNGLNAQMAGFIGKTYGQARHATSEDLVLLTTRSSINTDKAGVPAPFNKLGITYPLEDKMILTKSEITEIKTATADYNAIIKNLATEHNLAFVDANSKMVELGKSAGIQWDGVKYTAKFVTGGAFSLDGIHLTGRGYGIIANEFIKAINATYGSTLPQVNPNKYSGVTFPN